jgi:hypothetical protein
MYPSIKEGSFEFALYFNFYFMSFGDSTYSVLCVINTVNKGIRARQSGSVSKPTLAALLAVFVQHKSVGKLQETHNLSVRRWCQIYRGRKLVASYQNLCCET